MCLMPSLLLLVPPLLSLLMQAHCCMLLCCTAHRSIAEQVFQADGIPNGLLAETLPVWPLRERRCLDTRLQQAK